MVGCVVPRGELREATMWLARCIALNDSAALHLSKMQINQAWDMMGLTAAVRSSRNMCLGRGQPNRVSWFKSQNQRFEDYDKAYERPW
jgi:enoyl-CoA hydratase/carnithine racemase